MVSVLITLFTVIDWITAEEGVVTEPKGMS